MLSVFECVTGQHNIWLVLVAAVVCVAGAWTILRLFQRAQATRGAQSIGWHFLTAVAAGSSIWCTHFIGVLAYRPATPVTLDPVLTILSLLIAIGGASPGFVLAARVRNKRASAIGGAIIGLAIAGMHYTGMLAYRVEGIVTWDSVYLITSVLLSVVLSAVAMVFATRARPRDKYIAAGVLVLAIVSLHFTGMTAFQVHALRVSAGYTNPAALEALALAVAVVGLLIIGTGLASYLIDDQTRSDSFRKLRHMALNDPLTGLPNRSGFNDRLTHEVADPDSRGFSLIVIDLDRFKEINDVRGHSAGDEVLINVARRMTQHLMPGEFIARLGGDEFAAIHRNDAESDLYAFIDRLEKALFHVISLGDYEIAPGASIGVARYPQDATDQGTLINNADLAMYRAKTDLSRRVCFYEPSMDEAVRARRALAGELRDAIAANQLAVYYQPQNSVTTGDIVGFEALVRWTHPVKGPIPPSDFIPLAEETGSIMELGEWVLRTACADAAQWDRPYKVAVNLSSVQFSHPNLAKLVHEILIETGLSPLRLELELTETAVISDKTRSLHVLRQIKALGVNVALDDFGTGYSSLETLRTFPFDKIKLDRSFMSEVETSPQAKAIVRAVLALGKSLDVPVLAEGVETSEQLAVLVAEGCDEAQGYFLGRPAPIAEAYAAAMSNIVSNLSSNQRRWA